MAGDPLAGHPRPQGDPGTSASVARRYDAAAEQLDTCARQILTSVRDLAGTDWAGRGSLSAVGCTVVLAGAFARASAASRSAATGLTHFAHVLTQAQNQWDHARRLADEAVQDEAAYRSRAEQQAAQLDAQATAGDIAAGHLAASIRADAAGYASPLRTRAVALACDAARQAKVGGAEAGNRVGEAAAMVPPPTAAPAPVKPGDGGRGITGLMRWFNDWVLGGVNTGGSLLTLPPTLYAGARWWSAARSAAGLPADLQTLFDQSVGPLALQADRGLLPWSTVAEQANRYMGAASLFGSDSQAIVDGRRLAFLRGGLPDTPAFDFAGRGLGVLGIAGDAWTMIEPGGDSTAENTVNRSMAGANAVATIAVLNATTDEIPVAGEVVMVGSGVYLGGDWLYHHWSPFHTGMDATGHFFADSVPHFFTNTVPDAFGDAVDGAGHFFSSAGHVAGDVVHDIEPWHWG